jgi:cytochrome b subunit of formate dehydrogenase
LHPHRRPHQSWLSILILVAAAAAFPWSPTDGSGTLLAQEAEDCLLCHEDPQLTKSENGEVVSLYVDLARYQVSVHGQQGIGCTDCHQDLIDAEFPHEPELSPVDCGFCHDEVVDRYRQSLHGQAAAAGERLAPRCWDCHGAHDILPPADEDSRTNRFNIPFMCGTCHKEGTPVTRTYNIPQDSILAHYSLSIHGEGMYKRGLTISAVCTDCHTAHFVLPHTDPRSTIYRDNVARTCQACHGRIEEVHTKVIRGELWEKEPDKVPVCIECHQPHEARRVYYEEGMSDRECQRCHARHDLVKVAGSDTVSLFVDPDQLAVSDHKDTRCVQCHTGATPTHAERPCATIVEKVDCSICHAGVVSTYATSTHGKLQARGDPAAPDCEHCHGTHAILPHDDPAAPTYVRHIPDLCADCHGEGGIAAERYTGELANMVSNYRHSVHGRALDESGLVVSANCVDCHTSHATLPASDPASSINRSNIVRTCAQCHSGIFETFRGSIHFTGKPHGDVPLPMCNDCHSSHQIVRTDAAGFKREIVSTCGHCHEDVVESYFETFHGKVVKLGYTETAKCQDCHGAHNILPPEDPHSTLSRQNIVQTCAQCHPASHRQFAGYLTHATHHDRYKYPFVYWTWLFMTVLLISTFIFFGIHTLLWLPRSFQAKRHVRELRQRPGRQYIRRFDRLHRQLHILVIISFLGLAVTGMTLKFSYLPWAQALSHFMGGFKATGLIHRICALITFYYFGRHLLHVARRIQHSGSGLRAFLRRPDSMLPRSRDLREFGQTMRWFIGIGERPRYGRWTYWEKFDYFAVFWGVAVIGFSGLTLWFPEFFTRFLPGWFINVATIIHSDEALLATGFIFTVHFFNTHFRPDKFPMDPVIFTGRVELEEFKADRPREYEELVQSGELESRLVGPPNPVMAKALRVFGFAALLTGLVLIVLIIWAELFRYR